MLEQQNQVSTYMPSTSAANMSGISSSLLVRNKPHERIIDTGAINHMTAAIGLLNKGSISESVSEFSKSNIT